MQESAPIRNIFGVAHALSKTVEEISNMNLAEFYGWVVYLNQRQQ